MDTPLSHDAKEIDILAQAEPGEWVWLADRWPDASSTESTARYYLKAKEWEEYRTRTSRRRPHWLMGRIAAKDAVRRWLHARGTAPLLATAIEITPDRYGCPMVTMPGSSTARISIAHSGEFAVAFCHENANGIDIASVAQYEPGLETFALSPQERSLLDQATNDPDRHLSENQPGISRARMFTRFWAAKEAVSKAEGTGLRGNLTAFTVSALDGDCLNVVCQTNTTGPEREYTVQTSTLSGFPDANSTCAEYIVAWTRARTTRSCPTLD